MNDFECLRKLGSGQHGTVKLGRNLKTSEIVAIKILRRSSKHLRLGKNDGPDDRIKKEVAVLKKARHPHVVSLLEVIDDPEWNKVYLILEFVELGEIVWRKPTDKYVAAFELNRLRREKAGHFDEAHEYAEVERFNQTLAARRLEIATSLEEQRNHTHARLLYRNTQNIPRSLKPGPEAAFGSFLSPEHQGESEDDFGPYGTPPNRETALAQPTASAIPSRSLDNIAEKIMSHFAASAQLERPQTPGGPTPIPEGQTTLSGSAALSRVASPNLDGTMYGAYANDERRPTTLPIEPITVEQTHWSEAEEMYQYVPCLTLSQALEAFRDTVLGVEYLHYQGIIHRDLKPANLLWTADHRVKISDFGVSYQGQPIRDEENHQNIVDAEAVDLDEALELAKTVGTPAFYAPELCDPDLFDFRKHPERPHITGQIDVWALGVTLYCMIFGRLPFADVNEFTMYERIAREEVFIPRLRLKGVENTDKAPLNSNKRLDDILEYEQVNDDLRDLLKRLLEKHPSKRITLKEVKHHPWVLHGIKDPSEWIDATDPSLQSHGKKIEISTEDVEQALSGLTIVDRLLSNFSQGIRRFGSVVGRSKENREHRNRGDSKVKESDSPPSSVLHDTALSQEGRRSSLIGDEQIFHALRASREGYEHPLAHSVSASPEIRDAYSYFGDVVTTLGVDDAPASAPSTSFATRPCAPDRSISTAESMKTVKASDQNSQPESIPSPDVLTPMTTVIETGSASSLGGIFRGAGQRFISNMRSRERGRGQVSPSLSSRSSSVEVLAAHLEDPHASASLAFSSANAPGHVDQPPVLHEGSSSIVDTPTPTRHGRRPNESTTDAFARAQEQNYRRHVQEAVRDAATPPRNPASPNVECPPSPDDEIFRRRQRKLDTHEEAQQLAISSSDDWITSNISDSFSHPSMPSVISGASSLSTTTDVLKHKDGPLGTDLLPNKLGTDESAGSALDVTSESTELDDDEAGYIGDRDKEEDDDDEESEDEGITFGSK